MKHFLPLSLVLLAGCGGGSVVPKPNVQRDLETFPTVEFVGDEMSQAIVAASENPRYLCDDCTQGSDSNQVLAGFPAALATHPDIVVILTGTIDIAGNTFSATIGDQSTTLEQCAAMNQTCSNILAMAQQSQAAGAKVIIGTIPPFGEGTVEEDFLDMCSCDVGYEVQLNQGYLNNALLASYPPGNTAGVTLVDYASALQYLDVDPGWGQFNQYVPADTDGGIDPSAAGTAIMESMVNTAITALHVGHENN